METEFYVIYSIRTANLISTNFNEPLYTFKNNNIIFSSNEHSKILKKTI